MLKRMRAMKSNVYMVKQDEDAKIVRKLPSWLNQGHLSGRERVQHDARSPRLASREARIFRIAHFNLLCVHCFAQVMCLASLISDFCFSSTRLNYVFSERCDLCV